MIVASTTHDSGEVGRVQEDARVLQRAALDGFLRQTERKALRMAELATRNIDDALELVQDAMLGFVRHYADKPAADWPPLFYKVLDSRLLDFHRRRQVRSRWMVFFSDSRRSPMAVDEADVVQSVPDHGSEPPLRQLEGKQAMADLQRALGGLPDRQRQAFLLRHWEGFDGATTARIMGCSEGSVKTHLSRALHTLRQRLENHQ